MPVALSLLPGCVEACPACHHKHMTMAESLLQKENWLKARLGAHSALLSSIRTVPEEHRVGYRDKVCLSAEYVNNEWKIGVRKRGEVAHIPRCPVHTVRIRETVATLLSLLPPYDQFPLKYYVQSGAQLALVLKSREMPSIEVLSKLKVLAIQNTYVDGLWIHLNPSTGHKVFGKGGWHLVSGQRHSMDESGLHYGPAAFQQLLPSLYKQSLDEAVQFLQPSAATVVIDLYSGTGSSIRQWQAKGAQCLGVEISGDAINFAAVNVPGVTLLRGTCNQRIPQLESFLDEPGQNNKTRLLYANPPRTGLETSVINWIIHKMVPERIAYLSCSAGTLRRDLDTLVAARYDVIQLIPFDFFPNTRHVEVLSLLQKR